MHTVRVPSIYVMTLPFSEAYQVLPRRSCRLLLIDCWTRMREFALRPLRGLQMPRRQASPCSRVPASRWLPLPNVFVMSSQRS